MSNFLVSTNLILTLQPVSTQKEVKNEVRLMRNLRHQNIAAMRAFWKDSHHQYMLFDYAVNGDLSKFLREHAPLNLDTARFFLAHIVNGLEYLRSRNLMHRDLKPANIVLNENWIPKLADFGTAKTELVACKKVTHSSPLKRSEASSCGESFSHLSTLSPSGKLEGFANMQSVGLANVDNTSAISSEGILFE